MGSRLRVRRVLTRTLPVAALVLLVALLPSFGSSSVPAAVITGSAPSATVVHLLGDEVVPASLAPSTDRARAPAPGDTRLAVLLLAALFLAASLVIGPSTGSAARAPHRLVASGAVGRAPPRSFAHF